MSSDEDGENSQQGRPPRKRRVQRACDTCRRKKTRCNGGPRCSNCMSFNIECTYLEGNRKHELSKRYIEDLENCLKKMEKMLHKLCPGRDILKDLDAHGGLDTGHSVSAKEITSTQLIRSLGNPVAPLDGLHDHDFIQVNSHVDQLEHLPTNSAKSKYFGKSSEAMLVITALNIKREHSRPQVTRGILDAKRPEFWTTLPWEELSSQVEFSSYSFPVDDLLHTLINLYFDHLHVFLPLLHRPTFERSITAGQHLVDSGFGAVVLVVCALGSRYCQDPRVLLDGVTSYHSAGWKWFNQFYCLSVQYLQGCSDSQKCWVMTGIGVRMVQDVGAHRRKYNLDSMTVEDEMWKRAFWVLFCLDRLTSSSLGRPCVLYGEDFDIDLPVECDDEYWDHPDPAKRFKQPPNKPCSATAFVNYIKLLQILGSSLCTIYSIKKSKFWLEFVGVQGEQHIVAKLDSALNKWEDSIPDHLRWDPDREDKIFFNQAAWLYCTYYYVQIIIHKPFIPSIGKPSPLSFPSLSICTNAARSCSHIADLQSRRGVTTCQLHVPVFMSGIVLLLNIWSRKLNSLSTDPAKEMADVYRCMQILKQCESRWHPPGRLRDILCELAFVGDLPLPNATLVTPLHSNKQDGPTIPPLSAGHPNIPWPLNIDGSHNVKEGMVQSTLSAEPNSQSQEGSCYSLPIYSEELGHPPVHGQVAFSPQNQSLLNIVNPPYQNHITTHDISTPDVSGSTRPFHSYSSTYGTVGGSSLSTDGLALDSVGLNYTSFVPELSLSSSPLSGSMVFNVGSDSTGFNLHQMHTSGEGIPDLANAPAMTDSNVLAMWSNAPSGFDLDGWEAYISSVSEYMQGQPSN